MRHLKLVVGLIFFLCMQSLLGTVMVHAKVYGGETEISEEDAEIIENLDFLENIDLFEEELEFFEDYADIDQSESIGEENG